MGGVRDGARLLLISERDGDPVSAERGVYLDLASKISTSDLKARVAANLAAERPLRANGPPLVRADRRGGRESDGHMRRRHGSTHTKKPLFDFDSKHITRPGNKARPKAGTGRARR